LLKVAVVLAQKKYASAEKMLDELIKNTLSHRAFGRIGKPSYESPGCTAGLRRCIEDFSDESFRLTPKIFRPA
jgi:hypothetical protein